MKKILNLVIYLILSSIANTALAGNVLIYPNPNMQGRAWESKIQKTNNKDTCRERTEEDIPNSSFQKQFSIRTKAAWTCNVSLAGGKTICVDSEGWGNIEGWNNVEKAACHLSAFARCKGDDIKFDYSDCPSFRP